MGFKTYECDKCHTDGLDVAKAKMLRVELSDREIRGPPKFKNQMLCAKCAEEEAKKQGL